MRSMTYSTPALLLLVDRRTRSQNYKHSRILACSVAYVSEQEDHAHLPLGDLSQDCLACCWLCRQQPYQTSRNSMARTSADALRSLKGIASRWPVDTVRPKLQMSQAIQEAAEKSFGSASPLAATQQRQARQQLTKLESAWAGKFEGSLQRLLDNRAMATVSLDLYTISVCSGLWGCCEQFRDKVLNDSSSQSSTVPSQRKDLEAIQLSGSL